MMMKTFRTLLPLPLFIVALALATGCQSTAPQTTSNVVTAALAKAPDEPEGPSGRGAARLSVALEMMISVANPYAAQAGFDILKAGGSAIDAAIAAQMVLTLVEPQSSGIGGGGYLVHWDAKQKQAMAFDGRETAPANAGRQYFHYPDGTPMSRKQAGISGRSVGVPGVLRMLETVHRKHGRLPWRQLFAPAIELAERGFAVSPRLHMLVTRFNNIKNTTASRKLFLTKRGKPLPIGRRFINKDLARTFRSIAEKSANAFYTGEIAENIAAAVRNTHFRKGTMTPGDLAAYRVKVDAPICVSYRKHKICGVGPSTSGSVTVAMILSMLEHFDIAALKPDSPAFMHLFVEASRLAYADRAQYIADPAYTEVPLKSLLDPEYLRHRSHLISTARTMKKVTPGKPDQELTLRPREAQTPEPPSTSHLSVVDADGNAISMTSTVGWGFGSGITVNGFLLNNQLIAFNWRRNADGSLSVNHVDGGKRPRSSLSPMMVFAPDGQLRLVIGSPGGRRIIPYVAKAIIAAIDWNMDIQAAIALPNIAVNFHGEAELEAETWAVLQKPELEKLGHKVITRTLTSGLHGIEITREGLVGGADPRREGMALGR
jgi:gamma-glutamyltranspeptidase / glutathione hydrolase